MTGKTYPKDFERYWIRVKERVKNFSKLWIDDDGSLMSVYEDLEVKDDIKHMLFNAYRAGVRHTNGEHSRARARYFAKHRKRSWV